ncbi:MAG TPA: hypothetical protein VIX42_02035 [Edaphobacter sp.]
MDYTILKTSPYPAATCTTHPHPHDQQTRPPKKINPKILHKIEPPKTVRQQTIFTTQSTTPKPQNHHIQHAFSPKTPAKTPIHHKQKKRPGKSRTVFNPQ